jgi:ABC-type Mn2+/Zn2+ transport system permease subunit
MGDFIALLGFSALPLLLVSAFSLVTPGIGAMLALRNEIMLALALPSVAHAGMALGLLLGIDAEQPLQLYLFATATTLTATAITASGGRNDRARELRLAGLFATGQTLALLFTSLSSSAHAHIAHLLDGEVMAAGRLDTALIAAGCAGMLFAGFLSRKALFSWCIDEQFFRIVARQYRTFTFSAYALAAAAVTVGVATVGPLLMTALMVFPALLGDCGKRGIGFYAVMVTATGIAGSVAGFVVALALDLPPAVCSAAGVGIIGGGMKIFNSLRH